MTKHLMCHVACSECGEDRSMPAAALGVLASATRRLAYPNAVFALAEPKVSFDGRVTELAAQEEQVRVMLDELYIRLAEVTGREVDDIRADARRGRLLTAGDAISYGLIQGRAGR